MADKKENFPAIFKEILEPKSVHHVLFCNFVNPDYKSLVTIGSTHVEIYNFVNHDIENRNSSIKFDNFLSFNLNQQVVDAVNVRYYGDALDSILLSFEEACVSVLSYDPLSHEIKTTSLHFYEYEQFKLHKSTYSHPPMLRVDPEQRCAVVLVYDKNLGVIPFRRSPEIISASLVTSSNGSVNNKSKSSKLIPLSIPSVNITQHDFFSSQGVLVTDRPSPNLQTYVTSLNNLTGVKIGSIHDMQFLHGYYEPTLLILYDPVGTYVGQALTRKDTCCMITLSLNLQKCTNPIIWHLQNLPYDCFKLVPVPRPIGGIVIISPNILIYLNQSQPSCGFGLNGYAKKTTNFPLRHLNLLRPVVFSNCVCKFINSNQMLIITNNGDVFVTTLILEPVMKTVFGINIEKTYKTVIPTCMSVLSNSFVFVGSHLTDSVLLKYQLQESSGDVYITSETNDYFLPSSENNSLTQYNSNRSIRSYSFNQVDNLTNIGPILSMTISENYGYNFNNTHDAHFNRLLQELVFVELLCTTGLGEFGAVSMINLSMKPQLCSIFELSNDVLDMWWVNGGGPHVVGSENAAAAAANPSSNGAAVADNTLDHMEHDISDQEDNLFEQNLHTFMILTKSKNTMILEIDKQIAELEVSGFIKDDTTICIGNIGHIFYRSTNTTYPLTYQVTKHAIRILNGPVMLYHDHLDTEYPIIQVTATDRYIWLRTERAHYLVQLVCDCLVHEELKKMPNSINSLMNGEPMIRVTKNPGFAKAMEICSFCLYHDVGDWLNMAFEASEELIRRDEEEEQQLRNANLCDKTGDGDEMQIDTVPHYTNEIELMLYGPDIMNNGNHNHSSITDKITGFITCDDMGDVPEDIDLYLYGDKTTNEPATPCQLPEDIVVQPDEFLLNPKSKLNNSSNQKSWAFVLSFNGILEIYTVPQFNLIFQTNNFSDTPKLLFNLLKIPELSHLQASYENYQTQNRIEKCKFEIIVRNIGRNKDRPVLFARDDQELIMYELLAPISRSARYTRGVADYLRMSKLNHPCLLRPIKKTRDDSRLNDLHKQLSSRHNLFKPFENIDGLRGLFIAGSCPTWLFFTKDGRINSLPMYLEGVIPCFAANPANITNFADTGVPQFSYFNSRGELKMMNLPIGYDFEYQKAVKRISMKKTVKFVQYHIESKTFAVITCVEKEVQSIFKLNAENSKEEEILKRDQDLIRAPLEQYTLEFFANHPLGSWEPVPHARVEFEEWDKVTCMNTVQLQTHGGHATNYRDIIAVGSNLTHGEEVPVRGKILLADLADVVPHPYRPLTRHKLKPLYDQEQKGPVTALTSCRGLLVSALGQKIYIWQLRDGDLVGIAFVDSVHLYVDQLHCVRDLLLAGAGSSLQVLRFQPQLRVLSLVARNNSYCASPATNVSGAVNFISHNNELNMLSVERSTGNLIIYSYDPHHPDSRNGKILVRSADVRLPVPVHCSVRVNDKIRDPMLNSSQSCMALDHQDLLRQSVYLGSSTGSIYRINAITSTQLTQMNLIEKNLSQSFNHLGGLHPRTSRQYKFVNHELSNYCKNISDGNFLWQYITLPRSQKVEIATKAGINQDIILNHLTDVFASTLHF